jgi:ribosomal protein S18 acetylase RimI-like enzyme/predicted N-acetyltransferase YhbS
MQISLHPWHELDLHEIAQLTQAAKGATRHGGDEVPLEQTLTWLREQFAALPRFAALARSGDKLAGWVMLVVQSATTVEVNPWALGGHPLVAPGHDRRAVGSQLLQRAIDWARSEGFEVVELSIERDAAADPQGKEAFSAWVGSLGFGVREESVGFLCQLSALSLPTPVHPEGIEVRGVTDVDPADLYGCYYAALAAGQSRRFFDQSETERRAYFDTLGKTYGLHEATSLALLDARQIVGFSYTIPFGGDYLHLDWFGIHPDVRRRGRGRFLLRLVMERAAQAGFQAMGLSCDVGNAPAIALYRSLGWELQDDAEIRYAAKL